MQGGQRAVRQALKLEPENYWPPHVLVFILVRDDKPQELGRGARRVRLNTTTRNGRTSSPTSSTTRPARRGFAGGAGRPAAQARAGDVGWAYYNVATAQEKLGRAEEARAAYTASIRAYNQPGRTLDPDDLYLMGNAYLRLEQDAAAVKAFQQAIKVRPDFPQARFNLGVAYFTLGNRKGAQDEYNALRRLDPARAAKLQAIITGRPGRR